MRVVRASTMNRQPQDPEQAEHAGTYAVEVDPWVDFLSESSEELDALKSELLTGPEPVSGETFPDDHAGARDPAFALEAPTGAPPATTSVSVVVLRSEFPPEMPSAGVPPADAASATSGNDRVGAAADGTAPPPVPAELPSPYTIDAGVEDARDLAAEISYNPPAPVPSIPDISPTPAPAKDAPAISVEDVLQRQVQVRWSEAVAVIEELCGVLVRDGQTTSVPQPAHVKITAHGDVRVSKGRREHDVAALGRMLHTLMGADSPPLPLRLFVTASISSTRFDTIELFGDALSHYAAPNRRERIEGLCRRALEAPLHSVRQVTPPVLVDARKKRKPPALRQRVMRAVVTIAALAGSAAAGAWVARWTGPAAPAPVAATVSPAASPLAPAAVSDPPPDSSRADAPATPPPAPSPGASGAARGVGLVPAPPRPSSRISSSPRPAGNGGIAPAVPPGRGPQPAAIPHVQLPVAMAAPNPPAAPPTQPPAVAPPAVSTAIEQSASALPVPDEPAASRDAADGRLSETTIIYTSADRDVLPPVVLTAGALVPPPSVATEARIIVELLIDERGEVVSVQRVGRPQTFAEMPWLSSMKYQKFRPAMKDGSPVAYRLRVE